MTDTGKTDARRVGSKETDARRADAGRVRYEEKKKLPYNLYMLIHLLSYAEIFLKEAQSPTYDILHEVDLSVYLYDKPAYKNALEKGGILTFFPTRASFKIKEMIQYFLKQSYVDVKCDREWLDTINHIHRIDYLQYVPVNKCINLGNPEGREEGREDEKELENPSLSCLIISRLYDFMIANAENSVFLFDTLYLLTYIFRTADYSTFDFKYLSKLKMFGHMISSLEEQIKPLNSIKTIQKIHSKFILKIRDLLISFVRKRTDYVLDLSDTTIKSIDEIIAVFE